MVGEDEVVQQSNEVGSHQPEQAVVPPAQVKDASDQLQDWAREKKEGLSAARLTANLDKEKLAALKSADVGLRQPLTELVDRLMRLPETLDFQPGITLLVGDNGSGKTSLAKAIHFS